MNYKDIKISDYKYKLPDEKIAQYPLMVRDDSKLLVYKDSEIAESKFNAVDNFLPENSLMVFNNTKVIPARIYFYKDTGAKIEIFCLEPVSVSKDYQLEFNKTENSVWKCFVGNASKWKQGKIHHIYKINGSEINISAEIIGKEEDEFIIRFEWDQKDLTFGELIENQGIIPLPPYIRRDTEEADKKNYQTIYADVIGSVAAPTAGLHFTENVFQKLKEKNIEKNYLTLNVGAGTFKPVKSETTGGHIMHNEMFSFDKKLLKNILLYKKNIISVGTTSLRTLESIYWIGVKILNKEINPLKIEQWYPYRNKSYSINDSINAVIKYFDKANLQTIYANTELMIVPGYDFKVTDILITNFHLPGSTLLTLVSAFIGDDWKKVYDYALKNNFRFLSYGDSSILFKKEKL